jgi:fumarylacetoacetate (FAA) hydrolase
VCVSRDLTRCTPAGAVASTLQEALDNWAACEPGLRELADGVTLGRFKGEAFDEARCLSPLPRAFQWADGSAYVNHVELVRKARGAEMPESFWTDPLMYQGGSDCFLAPMRPSGSPTRPGASTFEAEVAVITDDVPMGIAGKRPGGTSSSSCWSTTSVLRNLIPGELAKGFGFFQSKPSSAFSPSR